MVSAFFVFFVSFIVILLFYLINKNEGSDYKMSSSFECGYMLLFSSRYSFSIPFVFMVMIFLFMDLEFCIIMPFMSLEDFNFSTNKIFSAMILVMIFSVMMEWNTNLMKWMS